MLKKVKKKQASGFTIVELLIVTVVIAILSAISVVAYSGIQARARDTQRLQDITSIAKALELYKAQTGNYPTAVGNSTGGWEVSSNPNGNHAFLQQLVDAGVMAKVPVDPVNTGDMTMADAKVYAYYRYPAGQNGCPTPFYALIVRKGEASSGVQGSPYGSCGTYGAGGWWVKIMQDA